MSSPPESVRTQETEAEEKILLRRGLVRTGDVSDCPLTQWVGVEDHDEEDEGTIVFSPAEEILGPDNAFDDVSVTT